MGLQEGLMLLGAAVFLLVLVDAIRRKRAAARREEDDYEDPEEAERAAQLARELPSLSNDGEKNASQRGLDPLFDDIDIFDDDPIPVLRNKQNVPSATEQAAILEESAIKEVAEPEAEALPDIEEELENPATENTPEISEEELAWDKMRRMFAVDPAFAEASRSSMDSQQKELQDLQEEKIRLAKEKQNQELLEQQEREAAFGNLDDLVEFEHRVVEQPKVKASPSKAPIEQPEITAETKTEEREQDLRTALLTSLEKSAWGGSEIFLTINVNAPENKPFVGSHLCQFMDIIGMKLSESGFYHYIEEKDAQSYLGYSLVNMFTPGNFDPTTEEDFETAGVVLVMPLPNTPRPMAVFERMLATARVMEKNWGAELQDEQRSNLTQQTIEHYRQTIKDFEYQTRVKAKKAKRV